MIKRILITIVMIFSFFGLFGKTNKFKTVDAVAMLKNWLQPTLTETSRIMVRHAITTTVINVCKRVGVGKM